MNNGTIYWLWLSLAVTPGSSTFSKLLSKCSDAEEIFALDKDDYVSLVGSKCKDITALCDKRLDKAEEIYNFCVSKNVGILVYSDEKYPKLLKEISNPPVLLYYRGVLPDFNSSFCVSVVGTRRLSEYGKRNAFNISFDLARAGATVVSGMAIGVDGVSHAGAIAAGMPTVAVMGSGIDVCYPKQHIHLAREIVKNGCVFTEYPPGSPPDGANFPIRNRIISGLSQATLIIEGRERRSGALWSARHAKEQGRAVYALPGNVGNINSELPNLLIKNGASVCMSADDIVRDFEKKSFGILDPFELAKSASVNMNEVLEKLRISSVAVDDKIFRHSGAGNKETAKRNEAEAVIPVVDETPDKSQQITLEGFDTNAVKIYQRIPQGEGCEIETLIDDELSLRVVMNALLKLEIGKFITMLPGERVRRNF